VSAIPSLTEAFTSAASCVARWTGRPLVFLGCCAVVIAWAASGPIFGFSDTWQLVINTGTTIVTFLMVFLIQNTQNRDNNAIQAKLDELIRVSRAKNDFIGIENLPDRELEAILREIDQLSTRLRDTAQDPAIRRVRSKAKARTTKKTPRRATARKRA
jgi:low affinity Fe/Cu permease